MGMKFRGVSHHKDGGWVAYISKNGTRVHLGLFPDFDNAKKARTDAEISLFGAIFDRREIEVHKDCAKIPLHSRGGVFRGWAVIDLTDLEIVKSIAWTIDPRGYVVGRPSGHKNSTTMHRWLMFGTESAQMVVDHRDRNKLNNRRTNLRLCTQSENSKNSKIPKNNTSGAKGVSLDVNGRWRARIWKDMKEIRIGTFGTVEEAKTAYDNAAHKLHGEFASPNYSAEVQVTPI
jgi:hypothetical protein